MEKLEILVVDWHVPGVEYIVENGREKKINFRPTAKNPNKYAKSIGNALKLVGGDSVNVTYMPTHYTNLDLHTKLELEKSDKRYVEKHIPKDNPRIENITQYNLIVLSGSNYPDLFSKNGDGKKLVIDSFAKELGKNIVDEANKKKVYVLGICVGDQILAEIHGHDVVYLDKPEAGWYYGYKTLNGNKDPILKGLPSKMILFNSHGKGVKFNGEYDKVCLVENANGPQIKRYSEYIIGSQFHLDDTLESSSEYLKEYNQFLGQKTKTQKPSFCDRIPEEIVRQLYISKKLDGHRIIGNILNII